MGFLDSAIKVGSFGLLDEETLFGDKGVGQQQAQAAENAAARQFFAKQAEQARGDIIPLFGQGQEQRALSSQQALDVFGGALPSQLDVFQRGNVAAQQALLGGQFTPQQLSVNTGFIPQTLAQPQLNIQDLLQQSQAQTQTQGFDRDISDQQAILDRAVQAGGSRNRDLAAQTRIRLEDLNRQRSNIQGVV